MPATMRRPSLASLLPFVIAAGLIAARDAQRDSPRDRTSTARFVVPVEQPGARWWKGNTHTHTTNSDGDTPPEQVAQWYKGHGYHFLVLSDHNVFTDPTTLASLVDTSFLLIPGEEVTTSVGRASVHINALDIKRLIPPIKDSTLLGTVQKNIDAIRAEGAIPHINHPNFGWSIDTATLFKVRNDKLLEIFNGHPTVHSFGGGDWPSMEAAWDALLTRGKRIYAFATDDAHHFQREFAPERSNPGRGWVVVRTARLDARAIMEALESGAFYASMAPVLDDITVTDRALTIAIRQRADFKYTTTFIGANGRVLAVDRTLTPTYTLTGDETYVRARVTDSGGRHAWVQPVFTSRYRDRAP